MLMLSNSSKSSTGTELKTSSDALMMTQSGLPRIVYIKFDPSDAKMHDSQSSSSNDYVVDRKTCHYFLGNFPQVLGNMHFLDLGTLFRLFV